MAGGIDEPVTIVEWDPAWPVLYEADAAELATALGDRLRDIQHFGSTAVPGLSAKPLIDILVALAEWPPATRDRDMLAALGYEDFGEAGVPGRIYLRRRSKHGTNLALVEHGGALWRDNLLLRDYLRSHPHAAQEYGQLKSAIWLAGERDLLAYSSAKAGAVSALLEAARQWAAS